MEQKGQNCCTVLMLFDSNVDTPRETTTSDFNKMFNAQTN